MNDDITLSAEQKALFDMMEETRQHLFITGKAGTGKSFLFRYFREHTKKKVVACAPTGIAALNIRGQTIHSLFGFSKGLQQKGSLSPNSRRCQVLRRVDTLLIDEVSMVRADLIDAIDARMREAMHNNLPFGGAQVIMYGDPYQLPPVVEDGLRTYFEKTYGGYFFFQASVWSKTEFKIYELGTVFRQKDPAFRDVLNAVRDGTSTAEQIEKLNERCAVPVPDEGTITLATTNALVTNINQRRLDQLEGQAFQYQAKVSGNMEQSSFPTEEIINLKVGAQVVLLQNDQYKRWVNGTVATIAALKKEPKKDPKPWEIQEYEEKITVLVDGIEYDLERYTWENIAYEYDPVEGKVKEEVTSSFTQYPIRLAWALTVHKSQGQTYESLLVDLTRPTFAPGQLYVALSRVTSPDGLYLKVAIKQSHIIVEPRVIEFMNKRETIKVAVVEEVIPPQQEEEPVSIAGNDTQATKKGKRAKKGDVSATPAAKKERGRPRKGGEKAALRVRTNVMLDATVKRFLQTQENYSAWIEQLICESPEFDKFIFTEGLKKQMGPEYDPSFTEE